MEFHVLPYTDEWETEWDRFVMKESGNGTFLHTRRFLNYQPKKKFTDASFLILNEKKAIAAVCPAAAVVQDGVKVLRSHPGSTYGGLVMRASYRRAELVVDIVRTADEYIAENFGRCELKATPDLFCTEDSSAYQYALYQRGYSQYLELSTYVELRGKTEENIWAGLDRNKKRNIKACRERGLQLRKLETDEEIAGFHSLLEGNLKKYGAVPVHSVADLLDFKNSRLTNETVFLGAFDEGRMVAAGMLFYFEQSRVLHAQNLPTDLSITEYSPVSALYYESMLLALRMGCKALSWGISTEDRGKTLNLGLIGSKEGYGSNKNLFRTFYKEY